MADDTNIDCSSMLSNSTEPFPLDSEHKIQDDNQSSKPSEQNTTSPEKNENSNLNDTNVESTSERTSANRASPEPTCSICLGGLQNRCFTDSCSHTFCFACLLEWSKVKPECPLCKVSFKSIVHNVRSNRDYDQYYVTRSEFETTRSNSFQFRARRTRFSDRRLYNPIISIGIEQHRITFAPHSLRSRTRIYEEERPRPEANIQNLEFRRRVYDENMWAKEIGRIRNVSPTFYRDNPACTHRLVPWLTRELTVLLDNDHRVSFVLDFIMSIILRYSITSKEFYVHTQSYLGSRTCHFVHEFYTFASSIYDMSDYDQHVRYNTLMSESDNMNFSSDSDIVTLSNSDDDFTVTIEPSVSSVIAGTTPSTSRSSSQKKKRPLTKLFLKKNRDNDSWNVTYPPLSPTSSVSSAVDLRPSSFEPEAFSQILTSMFDNPPPPTPASGKSTPVSIVLSSDSEHVSDVDDCVIVEELKPRWLRTPEVVDLSSDNGIQDSNETIRSPDLEPVSDGSLFFSDCENGATTKNPAANEASTSHKSNDEPLNFSQYLEDSIPYKKRKLNREASNWSSSRSPTPPPPPLSPAFDINSHKWQSKDSKGKSHKRKRPSLSDENTKISDFGETSPEKVKQRGEASAERLKSYAVVKPTCSRSSGYSTDSPKRHNHRSESYSKRHKHKKSKRKHEKHKYKKH